MSKLATRSNKLSGVLAFEEMPEYGVCRETGTVVIEAGMDVGAAVVATLVSGTGTATANASNTGNATISAVTVVDPARVGTYKVSFLTATTFVVLGPKGEQVGSGATGTAVVAANANGLGFTITVGATPMVAGDGFAIVVAGTVKWKWISAALSSALYNNKVAVVIEATKDVPSLTVGDNALTLLVRGNAGIVGASLQFKDALSAPQLATVLAAFKENSIYNRTKV